MMRHADMIHILALVVAAIAIVTVVFVAGLSSDTSSDAPVIPATATPTMSPTSTSTVTPTPTSTPEPVVYRLTWYGEEFRGGPLYCGSDVYGYYDPDDPTTVAGVHEFACGTRLELCAETCIRVVVKDACGGCGYGHLDVSRAAWQELGRPDYGTVRVRP